MLPLEVLERAQKELLCYGESGMSVMEMSHRTPEFEEILHSAEKALRKLMNIPANYKVLMALLQYSSDKTIMKHGRGGIVRFYRVFTYIIYLPLVHQE